MNTRRFAKQFLGGAVKIALAACVLASGTALANFSNVPAVAASASAAPSTRVLTALSGSQFDAGNIISDDQFYQSGAMSQAEIQVFLDAKIGSCSNSNCLNVLYTGTESRASDRTVCGAFTADSDAIERASAIIYKVQQACGISAKVILVTLQKEQGLVTSKGPTVKALGAAMGWGCPDTAPCDGAGKGFFRQVYGAAWQFKRYTTPDLFGNYHIGTYSIAHNPDPVCGRQTVAIRNNATAALYNFTPYTPNAATLANLRGSAYCGAYGNRNFWVYYNDWFGNPTNGDGLAHLAEKYAASGGAAGPLGTAVGPGTCGRSVYSCYQNYQHGVIYWSVPFGAFAVSGGFGDYYLAKGGVAGPLGPPTSDYYTVTDPNGDGHTQGFATGMIYEGPPGRFAIMGAAQPAYVAAGWLRGPLGWPTSEQTCASGGCVQSLERGMLYGAVESVAVMDSTLDAAYRAAGGPTGPFGWPISAVTSIDGGANGNGRTVGLNGGMLYSSASGTFLLPTQYQKLFVAAGWVRGSMGWPVAAPSCNLPGGGCRLAFQHGDIYVPAAGVGFAVSDPTLAAAYRSAGGPSGSLGWPISATTDIDGEANGVGRTQGFTNGMMYLREGSVTALDSRLQKAYVEGGWIRGPLGWPTAAPDCTLPDGGCRVQFQHGTLYQPPVGAGFAISDSRIAEAYVASGGPAGPLGWPISLTTRISTPSNGDGYAQGFTGGMIYASAVGTFSLPSVSQKGFVEAGWLRGPLGWPTAAPSCSATGCVQQFQGGVLYSPANGAAFGISDSRIASYYGAHGSFGGEIGYPTTATTLITTPTSGEGFAQGFQGGYIYSSALGTFWLSSNSQKAFTEAGWLRGPLGWPKAESTCAAAGCVQQFQSGVLYVPSSGPSFGISDSRIAAYYDAHGGFGGPIGYPTTATAFITTPTNGEGFAQGFQGGYIYASALGTYSVMGEMETKFLSEGWLRGRLGFPVGDAACSSSCTQQFAHGSLSVAP